MNLSYPSPRIEVPQRSVNCLGRGRNLPRGTDMRKRKSLETRFWAKVRKTESCWIWTAYRDPYGYGKIYGSSGRSDARLAHRISYELHYGLIPGDLQVDHLCRNPSCVNPTHLELVTMQENIRRSPLSKGNRTHCPKGHPYDDENTIWFGPNNQWRKCRICYRAEMHRQWLKRKAKGLKK